MNAIISKWMHLLGSMICLPLGFLKRKNYVNFLDTVFIQITERMTRRWWNPVICVEFFAVEFGDKRRLYSPPVSSSPRNVAHLKFRPLCALASTVSEVEIKESVIFCRWKMLHENFISKAHLELVLFGNVFQKHGGRTWNAISSNFVATISAALAKGGESKVKRVFAKTIGIFRLCGNS